MTAGRSAAARPRSSSCATRNIPGVEQGGIRRLFAEPTRLRIIQTVAGGPRTVTDLVRELGIERVNLPHHMRLLRDAGVVAGGRGQRGGGSVAYRLAGTVEVAGGLEFAHPSGVKVVIPVS